MPQSSQKQEPIYELKHRITGAIILMSAAVLIIPILLSEPGAEAKSTTRQAGAAENTFRSRIVPLDISNVNRPVGESGGELPLSTREDSRPALLDLTVKARPESPEEIAAASPSEPNQADEPAPALVMTREKKDSDEEKNSSPAASPPETESKAEIRTADAAPATAQQPAGPGWVVRVGTFSRQANVESVSTLLSNSGFEPRTTPVTTSLGESTRVWLGPYAERETADRISDRLKSLTGEKGYVTRTSS
jgi:DedD protein